MNADTTRKIAEIKRDGYYRSETTLGEGGWAAVMKFASDWKNYQIWIEGELASEISAKDDKTALSFFENQFRLDEAEYTIVEKIVSYRTVR